VKAPLRIVAPLAGLALLLALVVALSFRALGHVEAAAEARKRSYALIIRADALLSDLRDAETGERGYLLTGDEAFLEPYLAVRDSVSGHLEALRPLTLLSTSRKHLDALAPLVAAKLSELSRVIELRRHQDIAAALAAVKGGRGKQLMDSIRAEMSAFIQIEDGALARHEAELQSNLRRLLVIIATASLFALLLAFAFAYLIYREVQHRLVVIQDGTDRARAGEALRSSEADFRGLVEHAPLGIYRVTPDGHFLTVNPALIKMLGYGGVAEMTRLDIVRDVYADPERRAKPYTELAQRDEAGTEAEWTRRDGSLITVRVIVRRVPGRDGQIECYEGVVEDVTQQRSLENQFRQAQRMEAVGRLAGGVAHDFNNILTAITGYSELLLEDLGSGDPHRSDVEEIKAAALRATALTRQLLAFSRKQVLQTRVLDLNGVVRTLDKMLHRLVGEDIKLGLSLASALSAVRADPGQIEQVILNLAVNSRDAMPNGGSLTIETANVDLDEAYAREHAGASPGRYVMLAVTDTGIGMDAKTRSQVFEPFFTTKELGRGTGLGLSTVYGIVKQSGGYVWVDSEPGHGATFKIYLPRVDELPAELDLLAPVEPVTGGRETVLLAEDDPSVRAVMSDVLTQKGYRVLRAPDGKAALDMARGQPGEIHLLVTDIVMPGLTGRELAEALMAERPGLRVLYVSGYTDDAVVRHGVLQEGMPYLQKPFAPRVLASKVREVLDRGSRDARA
jgi:two-component system cell cycle sensor histidine kinase/response regulator CckA